MKNRKGQLITVFGPDGSGKSTTYLMLKKSCTQKNIILDHYHWRPGLLPYKKRITKNNKNNSFIAPHENKSRNMFLSFLLLLYIYLDFVLGYIFILKPKLNKGINIYYERYFHDILVDQIRYRIKVPFFLRKFLSYFVFNPDRIIILEAPSSVIFGRKQELSEKEITTQITRLKRIFNNNNNNLMILNVSKNNEIECSNKVFNFLFKEHE